MVIERQTLLVLHTSNFTEFAWADGELSARTERVWIAWASVPPGRSAGDSHENKQNTNETHLASDAYLISRLLAHPTAKLMPICKIRHERSLKIPSYTLVHVALKAKRGDCVVNVGDVGVEAAEIAFAFCTAFA